MTALKPKYWRAWYADKTVRDSNTDRWVDGAVKVLIQFEEGHLIIPGDMIKGGELSFEVQLKQEGARVVELSFSDGMGMLDR